VNERGRARLWCVCVSPTHTPLLSSAGFWSICEPDTGHPAAFALNRAKAASVVLPRSRVRSDERWEVGSRPKATPDERQHVFELADDGESPRRIAQIVFGSTRFHGRVRRLLDRRENAVEPARTLQSRLQPPAPLPEPAAPVDEFDQQTIELEAMTKAMKRQIAGDLVAGKAQPMQLEAVNRLEIAVANRKLFARARDLTRLCSGSG
jgi:hypothetical protein